MITNESKKKHGPKQKQSTTSKKHTHNYKTISTRRMTNEEQTNDDGNGIDNNDQNDRPFNNTVATTREEKEMERLQNLLRTSTEYLSRYDPAWRRGEG